MKTRVNLYLPEFKPPKEILTLTRVILITLAVLAVMIAWTVYSRDQLAQQQRKNQELTDRQITLSDEVLKAVSDGKFAVHTVETIDETIELLTGVPAGPDDDPTSVYGRRKPGALPLSSSAGSSSASPPGTPVTNWPPCWSGPSSAMRPSSGWPGSWPP